MNQNFFLQQPLSFTRPILPQPQVAQQQSPSPRLSSEYLLFHDLQHLQQPPKVPSKRKATQDPPIKKPPTKKQCQRVATLPPTPIPHLLLPPPGLSPLAQYVQKRAQTKFFLCIHPRSMELLSLSLDSFLKMVIKRAHSANVLCLTPGSDELKQRKRFLKEPILTQEQAEIQRNRDIVKQEVPRPVITKIQQEKLRQYQALLSRMKQGTPAEISSADRMQLLSLRSQLKNILDYLAFTKAQSFLKDKEHIILPGPQQVIRIDSQDIRFVSRELPPKFRF